MVRNTFLLMFQSVTMICDEFNVNRDEIIFLEQIMNSELLANWENYSLGIMLKRK